MIAKAATVGASAKINRHESLAAEATATSRVIAVWADQLTGKNALAVERMMGHSSA